jgi:hypothetical protein
MRRIIKRFKTLFTMDWGWFYRFTRKRLIQRVGHLKTRLTGRTYVEVIVQGTAIKLSTLTPYHHSITQHILTGDFETRPLSKWLEVLR